MSYTKSLLKSLNNQDRINEGNIHEKNTVLLIYKSLLLNPSHLNDFKYVKFAFPKRKTLIMNTN